MEEPLGLITKPRGPESRKTTALMGTTSVQKTDLHLVLVAKASMFLLALAHLLHAKIAIGELMLPAFWHPRKEHSL